ncbi:MAG: hemerythrin domain-containing protein [Myxococcota bacterium]
MDGPSHIPPRLDLPREQWADHPHYPSQVLLMRSHEGFREISRQLLERAREGIAPRSIAWIYPQWIAGMRSHEGYEEYKLYPFLRRRWGVSMESLKEGHQQLHRCDDAVRAALLEHRNADGDASNDALVRALEEHDRVLVEHLRHEEDTVIPLLLELSPDEFDEYCHHSIAELLRRLESRSA